MTIGLNCDREILYSRIDTRVDRMIANGLVEEVRNLRAIEYGRDLPAMSGLGYRQVYAYLEGEMDLDDCVERIKFETHRFARQQHNWFRQDDHRINWYDTGQSNWRSRVIQDVRHYLASASLK
jgi:tRNA dimethylallyltransferase